MPSDLFNLEFDEISMVPSGDNPAAHIVMSKADPELLKLNKAGAVPANTSAGNGTQPESGVSGSTQTPTTGTPNAVGGQNTTPCPTCDGDGKIKGNTTNCPDCNGTGTVPVSKDDTAKPTLLDLNKAILNWPSVAMEDQAKYQAVMLKVADDLGAGDDVVTAIKNLPVAVGKAASGTTNNDNQKGGTVLTKEQQAVIDGLPDDQKSLFAELSKADTDETNTDDGDGAVADITTDDEETALSKADPAIRKLVEKARAETAEATTIAKAERDLRVHREMVAKASEFKNLTGTAEEKAEILKAAYAVGEENGQKIEQMMKAANAQLDESGVFTQFGKSAPGADLGTNQEIEARAAELRKANPTMSVEKSKTTVLKSDPTLYDRLMKESASHAG